MRTADFDYGLPPELIAQEPAEPRDSSRLLVLYRATGETAHRRRFSEIVEELRPGDLLVFNDSRVIPARLYGTRKDTGGAVELLLLQRLERGLWRCLGRPGRRLRPGTSVTLHDGTTANVIEVQDGGIRLVRFDDETTLEQAGQVPLPPYIHTPLADPERYQTVYARIKGSVAAPTAGLHFTQELLEQLRAKGVEMAFVTLHIGLDTFRPVQAEDPLEHKLHSEPYELPTETARAVNEAKAEGRRVIAVGTTAVRVLEHVARACQRADAQYPSGPILKGVAPMPPPSGGDNRGPSGEPQPASAAGPLQASSGWADLFILPGFKFQIVDAMLTNFHLPRSTLLMLVCAFGGYESVMQAYREAIEQRYRFYSFGDAMLVG
ncbi:MAG: tRNA preQ1(34) S-adenosylmethionine ribosyltransferase-isomerase QueA [Chloroflexi bacterium]|nr:tRNA preQ1(34) S-adenosylmethionine ribosyltransferase-isomerase QueA [Chloroflexota bacterium]